MGRLVFGLRRKIMIMYYKHNLFMHKYGSVVAELLRAPNSNSGVSDGQAECGFESPVVTLLSFKQDT